MPHPRSRPSGSGPRPPEPSVRILIRQQAALARAERQAALGELCARLGHTLRNPLSGVLLSLANLRAEVRSPDQEERLGLAIAELERVGHLLTGILASLRPAPEAHRRLDLHGLVAELAELAGYCIDERLTLVAEVPQGLCCRLPETGLRLALLQLIRNAAEALAGGPGTIRIQGLRHGGCALIAVCDDGPGFPERLLGQWPPDIASVGPGADGLGLPTVWRFAAANSGRLRLSNLPGGGACATLSFPLE